MYFMNNTIIEIPDIMTHEQASIAYGEAIISLFVPMADMAASVWTRDEHGWGVTLPDGSIGLGKTPYAAINAAVGIGAK